MSQPDETQAKTHKTDTVGPEISDKPRLPHDHSKAPERRDKRIHSHGASHESPPDE